MIVVNIKSGLGNQMFQYALGRRLSLDWRDELKFDFSWFSAARKGETPRDLEINRFNINLPEASPEEIRLARGGFFTKKIVKTIDRIRGRLDRNYFFRFHGNLLKKKKFAYLDGYFQSHKYFDSIRAIILADFELKNGYTTDGLAVKNEIEQAGQSIGLHVRRGDFVTTCKDWNGLCDADYYQRGLSKIAEKFSVDKLFVFSDDIEWAKENLKFNYPMVFVFRPGLSSVEELKLMSLCKHQIIANSTFSWWSAWLNQNNEKIVIAPSRWLLAADIDTRDLIPENWIKI